MHSSSRPNPLQQCAAVLQEVHPAFACEWPDRHFVPEAVRDYSMFAVPSSAGGGAMVTGAGGR